MRSHPLPCERLYPLFDLKGKIRVRVLASLAFVQLTFYLFHSSTSFFLRSLRNSTVQSGFIHPLCNDVYTCLKETTKIVLSKAGEPEEAISQSGFIHPLCNDVHTCLKETTKIVLSKAGWSSCSLGCLRRLSATALTTRNVRWRKVNS